MKGSGRPRSASTAAILSLLILPLITIPRLLLTNAAHASPVIVCESRQMYVNGKQTLTVSGDCDGPLALAIVSGGGTLSSGSGDSVIYTATATNAHCKKNPSISLSCNGVVVDTLDIAVTNSPNYYALISCAQPGPPLSAYHCENLCTCGGVWQGTDSTCLSYCGPDTGHLGYNPCNPPGIFDIRAEGLKEAGCCPLGLPPEPGAKTHDAGSSCSIMVITGSATNLRSGNFYHGQDVGTLVLSYNSISPDDSPLGKKWTHRYNEKLTVLSDNATLILRTDDGNVIYFHVSGGVYYPEAISGDTSRIVKNPDNTYTRTLKNGTAYGFDASGRLILVTDRNGKNTALTYNGSDLAGITDPNGRTTTFSSSGGKIMSMTDPAGRTYNLAYTGGLLTAITDPLNNVWQYTYDIDGRMLTRIDPAGRTVSYTYDASGRLLTSTDPEGKTRTMHYAQSGTTALTEKDGGIWTYRYDPTFAVKTRQTDPLGNITRYGYDLKRNLVSVTDPDGGITRYTYDGNSNLICVTDPLNHTTGYTYNALNLIASRTDPRGGVTTYNYDANGNLTSTTDPAGTNTFQYDTKGNITAMTDADNRTTVMTYDVQNNL
ncbi:MAG: RHS repeat protein, partial [Deltaproteobacteria bacterium]|nr:RHS repeat protein [Deltaproteobacteria bacterium]